ncbi:MAG TPA: hypothetical protein VKY24_04390 [Reyranella sp.]|jgi:hypothetical protein|nr:hypothetical protein [Reyranella sp.]
MRLVGWVFKLGALGAIYFGMTSGMHIKLPDEILGYKVPATAQQWVDRNAQIAEYGKKTQAGFQTIADSLGKH